MFKKIILLVLFFSLILGLFLIGCGYTVNKQIRHIEKKLEVSANQTMIEFKIEQDVIDYATDPWIVIGCDEGNIFQRSACKQYVYYTIEQDTVAYVKRKILIYESLYVD